MTVKVTRRVLATSKEEAIEKADTEDMTHEIKNYSLDEELSAEEVAGSTVNEYDIMDDIAAQIVQNASHEPMHWLQDDYVKIREINEKLMKSGKPAYEPPIFNRLTKEFLNRLKG
ncbi:hypothetical protein [Evansella clarkii]|uniref:hypothetical protein n=1 Tax=Evansella clarkii TaxID=79879 RepID=UPI001C46BCD1|nr:hypothetical protein [Evansella clarkii]